VIALGLALTLVAAGATVFAVIATATSSTPIHLTALGVTISASPLDLFIAGALSVVLLGLGFSLISKGTRRSARTHKELRSLRKDKAATAKQAAAERENNVEDSSNGGTPGNGPGSDNDKSRGGPSAAKGSGKNPADSEGTGKGADDGAAKNADGTDQNEEAPLVPRPDAEPSVV
jgi:hypothetical protein